MKERDCANCKHHTEDGCSKWDCEFEANDLISRADAIRWVKTECNPYGKPTLDYDSGLKVIEHLKKMPSELPSAEIPTESTNTPTNTPTDLISRADAIEEISKGVWNVHELVDRIKALPSADAVSREDYHNLLTATEDIDRALREYQAKDEKPSADAKHDHGDGQWYDLTDALTVERNEWIPCNERLPKKGEVVLITNGKGNVRCGQYRSEHDVRNGTHYWWWKGKTIESVLAWMPLPEPYKAESEEV